MKEAVYLFLSFEYAVQYKTPTEKLFKKCSDSTDVLNLLTPLYILEYITFKKHDILKNSCLQMLLKDTTKRQKSRIPDFQNNLNL